MQTPAEIREFLYGCQQGDPIGLDLRGDLHLTTHFESFDGEKLRVDGDGARRSISFDEIRRVVVEFTTEGPE